jgi:hypothetical protein
VKSDLTLFRPRWIAATAVVLAIVLAGLAIWPRAAPRATAPSGFRGRIFDRDHRAIARAQVEAVWIGQDDPPRTIATARANADGDYRLIATPPAAEQGVLALRVSAVGYGTAGRRVTVAEPRQDFRLVRGATDLTLRVVSEDGAPIAAADVVVSIEPAAGSPDELVVLDGKTGADGAWRVPGVGVEPGALHWLASAPGRGRGFGQLAKPAGDAPIEIVARMAAGAALVAALVDKDGAPVTGATVIARELDGPWRDSAGSDPAGAARIAGAPRDVDLALEVTGDWILAGESEQQPLRLAPDERDRTIKLVVEPAGRIEGTVVTTRGAPIAAAVVAATPSDHVLTRHHAVATAPDGSFVLRGLRAGTTWDLEVRHPARAPAFQDRVAARTRGLRVELHEGGTLVGGVDDDLGRPFPGLEVYVHRVSRGEVTQGLREHATVKTGADGGFRIEHLSEGDYRVEYRAPARMAWSATATQLASASLVDGQEAALERVQLARGASLRVVARTADGAVIPHETMKVSILPADQGGAPHRVDARTGADGAFQIDDLVAGTYKLAVRSDQHGFARGADLRLATAGLTTFDARFADAEALVGSVVDATGQPVVGALVDAYTPAHGDLAPVGRAPDDFTGNSTHTDEAGRFRIAGLASGAYQLRVSSPRAVPLALQVTAPGDPLALRLPPAATLHVRVDAPAKGSILIESRDGAGYSASKAIGPDGTADFTLLPAGEYKVRAGLDRMLETHTQVRAGEEVRVRFDNRSAPTTEKAS